MRRMSRLFAPAMKIIECPRDAIQGLREFIPTGHKQRYINALLKCGFHTVDFGSFVSANAIPQMKDTTEVLRGLDLSETKSKLLAVVVNERGCQQACKFPEITYIGFPLSVNQTFQMRNTKKNIAEAFEMVRCMQDHCLSHDKVLVVYLSMAFGNPYGEPYDPTDVEAFADKLNDFGIQIISLADTTGCSSPELIGTLFSQLIPKYPHIEFGAHFHTAPARAMEKISAAYHAGVRRFDGALGGMGGCPFAASALTGNVATETLLAFCDKEGIEAGIDRKYLLHAEDIRVLSFSVPIRELMIATAAGDEKQLQRMCRAHFDAADVSRDGSLSFDEFQKVMLAVYQELGETPPSIAKLQTTFEQHARNGRLHFDAYLAGARQGLQKRLRSFQQ